MRAAATGANRGHAGWLLRVVLVSCKQGASLLPTAGIAAASESRRWKKLEAGPGRVLLPVKRPGCSFIKRLSKVHRENAKAPLWRIETRNAPWKC